MVLRNEIIETENERAKKEQENSLPQLTASCQIKPFAFVQDKEYSVQTLNDKSTVKLSVSTGRKIAFIQRNNAPLSDEKRKSCNEYNFPIHYTFKLGKMNSN